MPFALVEAEVEEFGKKARVRVDPLDVERVGFGKGFLALQSLVKVLKVQYDTAHDQHRATTAKTMEAF